MPPDKKRRKYEIEEIKFDPAARQEYLTGFRKRKQERKQNAQTTAAKKAREEKVKERRQIREQRREDLDKHVAAVNEELRKQNQDIDVSDSESAMNGDSGEWNGIQDASPAEDLEQDAEYLDEDKYTTVTVEAMDDLGQESESDVESQTVRITNGNRTQAISQRTTRSKEISKPAKKKKLKFRYESKAERQATRQKQKIKGRAAKARRMG